MYVVVHCVSETDPTTSHLHQLSKCHQVEQAYGCSPLTFTGSGYSITTTFVTL